MGGWWDLVPVFVGVFLAFVLAEAAARVTRRRERIEAATFELAQILPPVVASRMSVTTSGDTRFDLATHLLLQVRTSARWPVRGASSIRREAEDLMARLAGVELRAWRGEFLSVEDVTRIGAGQLIAAVFGEQDSLDKWSRWYLEHGFEGRPPDDR